MTDISKSDGVPQIFPAGDVRNDPIGPLNSFINWVFTGSKPRVLRRLVGLFFHIELPKLAHPVRMAHPFGIVVNGGATLGRNVTIFQHVTIGSKRSGRNAGVATVGDDVVIYPNAVVVGGIAIGGGPLLPLVQWLLTMCRQEPPSQVIQLGLSRWRVSSHEQS